MNKHNLKVGDLITFTNKVGALCRLTVNRIEDKSVYVNGWARKSWNTLNGYIERYNATIKRDQL